MPPQAGLAGSEAEASASSTQGWGKSWLNLRDISSTPTGGQATGSALGTLSWTCPTSALEGSCSEKAQPRLKKKCVH